MSTWRKMQLWTNSPKISAQEWQPLHNLRNIEILRCLNSMRQATIRQILRSTMNKWTRKLNFGMMRGRSYGRRLIPINRWLFKLQGLHRNLLVILTGVIRIFTICLTIHKNCTQRMDNLQLRWLRKLKKLESRNCINWGSYQKPGNNFWKQIYFLNCIQWRKRIKWGRYFLIMSSKTQFQKNSEKVSFLLWTVL